jgi:hypothetical protein
MYDVASIHTTGIEWLRDRWSGKDLEGSGYGLTDALSCHFSAVTEKTQVKSQLRIATDLTDV